MRERQELKLGVLDVRFSRRDLFNRLAKVAERVDQLARSSKGTRSHVAIRRVEHRRPSVHKSASTVPASATPSNRPVGRGRESRERSPAPGPCRCPTNRRARPPNPKNIRLVWLVNPEDRLVLGGNESLRGACAGSKIMVLGRPRGPHRSTKRRAVGIFDSRRFLRTVRRRRSAEAARHPYAQPTVQVSRPATSCDQRGHAVIHLRRGGVDLRAGQVVVRGAGDLTEDADGGERDSIAGEARDGETPARGRGPARCGPAGHQCRHRRRARPRRRRSPTG